MRLIAYIGLLLCLMAPAQAQDACRTNVSVVGVQGFGAIYDAGIDSLYREVAARAGFGDDDTPILCKLENTSVGPVPLTFQFFTATSIRYAIALPAFALESDRETITGIMAHELAHPRRGLRTRTEAEGLAEEIASDALAAQWVGKDAVRAFLRLLLSEAFMSRTPPAYRERFAREAQARITALQ
ncbi:MAG: hypothetical protein Athens041674_820 [Parcubacteria group bacterium Athens0416_74]|nr:MAG: hypothetical protein Athens041674_820 [Parcubacteria group bacterium Athens0416_74]